MFREKRETDRQTDRQTETQAERETDREREPKTETERDRDLSKNGQKYRKREKERETETETERQTDRETQTDRDRQTVRKTERDTERETYLRHPLDVWQSAESSQACHLSATVSSWSGSPQHGETESLGLLHKELDDSALLGGSARWPPCLLPSIYPVILCKQETNVLGINIIYIYIYI